MRSYHWSMLGLVLDIFGAFLLSVEAIKIENLRNLRDRFFIPFHRHTESPRITFGEGIDDTNIWSRHLVLFQALHWIAGIAVFAILNSITSGWLLSRLAAFGGWYWSRSGWTFVLLLIPALYCVLLISFGVWALGEGVHIALTFLTGRIVLFLEWIDRKTLSGAVGLIGFVLLLLGFALQMYGTYMSGVSTLHP